MIIDGKIKLLGDPHLGREFRNNVPLHRRGERERLVMNQFVEELDPQGYPIHICMGDLFDKPLVSNSIVIMAAQRYAIAAMKNMMTVFYVIAGNHDESRDQEVKSSFEVFERIVRCFDNIVIVRHYAHINPEYDFAVIPWHPFKSAAEVARFEQDVPAEAERRPVPWRAKTAFGHWDCDLRSNPFNLIPTQQLRQHGVTRAYTGHVHLPGQFKRDSIDVTVVGSMQPYAHGEDADGTFYVTRTLDQIDNLNEDYTNKCLRVRLGPEEIWDRQINCLQLQVEKIDVEATEQSIDVSLGDFNLLAIFEDTIAEAKLPPTVETELRNRWQSAFT